MEKVRQRLMRAVAILEESHIPYAVVGGNAVAAWVSRVDEAAVRNTQDVDILVRRNDLPDIIEAMSKAGFAYRRSSGIDMFLDGTLAKAWDAVHRLAQPDDLVCVTGSFFLAAEMRRQIAARPLSPLP